MARVRLFFYANIAMKERKEKRPVVDNIEHTSSESYILIS
jgi:hypothetical protein